MTVEDDVADVADIVDDNDDADDDCVPNAVQLTDKNAEVEKRNEIALL